MKLPIDLYKSRLIEPDWLEQISISVEMVNDTVMYPRFVLYRGRLFMHLKSGRYIQQNFLEVY